VKRGCLATAKRRRGDEGAGVHETIGRIFSRAS